jgi:hypothetical protein
VLRALLLDFYIHPLNVSMHCLRPSGPLISPFENALLGETSWSVFYKANGAGIAESVQRLTMGWAIEESRLRFPAGKKYYITFRLVLRPTQPAVQWLSGEISLGIRRPGREAHQLRPSSA